MRSRAPLARFGIVAIPPKSLCKELRVRLNKFVANHPKSNLFPLFDPHITLLYARAGSVAASGLARMEDELHRTLPITVHYGAATTSNYGTVRLNIVPHAPLRRLHAALLAQLADESDLADDAGELFRRFNTTNIGDRYRPYVTIARFRTRELAESFRTRLDGIPRPVQAISQVWLADASQTPLRLLRPI